MLSRACGILFLAGLLLVCASAAAEERADTYTRVYQEANQLESAVNQMLAAARSKVDGNCSECKKRYKAMESDWQAMQKRIQSQIYAGYETADPQAAGINTYRKACADMRQLYSHGNTLIRQTSGTLCGQPRVVKPNIAGNQLHPPVSDQVVATAEEMQRRIDAALGTLPGQLAKELSKTVDSIGNLSTAMSIIDEIAKGKVNGTLTTAFIVSVFKAKGYEVSPLARAGLDDAIKMSNKKGTIEKVVGSDPEVQAEFNKLKHGGDSDDPLARMMYLEELNGKR